MWSFKIYKDNQLVFFFNKSNFFLSSSSFKFVFVYVDNPNFKQMKLKLKILSIFDYNNHKNINHQSTFKKIIKQNRIRFE